MLGNHKKIASQLIAPAQLKYTTILTTTSPKIALESEELSTVLYTDLLLKIPA